MKIGMRKPNLKKRVKARTTGKIKRSVKKSVNPLYGKKGMGLVNNPKKAVYNKVYNKTTFDIAPTPTKSKKRKSTNSSSRHKSFSSTNNVSQTITNEHSTGEEISNITATLGCFGFILLAMSIFNPTLFFITIPLLVYVFYRTDKEQKEFAKKNEEKEKELLKFNIINQKNERLENFKWEVKNSEKNTRLNSFFESVDSVKEAKKKYTEALNLNFEKGYITQEELIAEKKETEDLVTNLIKKFINNYEDMSLEKASRLKTEKGQRNNYQRSLDDLKQFDSYFTSEINDYIEERWQKI